MNPDIYYNRKLWGKKTRFDNEKFSYKYQNKQMKVSVTKEEYELIEKLSNKSSLTVSAFIRNELEEWLNESINL